MWFFWGGSRQFRRMTLRKTKTITENISTPIRASISDDDSLSLKNTTASPLSVY